jgi:two-component system sensor kinase FixL
VKLPRLTVKPALYRVLRYLPMPLLAMLVGLGVGLVVWSVLDQVQSRKVEEIFNKELTARLDLRSRESLLRFDQYMANYAATARLLANYRRLAQYLEPLFWFPEDTVEPVVYEQFRPFWLPDFFGRNALLAPSHVALMDSRGQVREIYQGGEEPLPPEMLTDTGAWVGEGDDVQAVLARFGDRLFLVVSDRVEDAGGYRMGHLMVVVPVDESFLGAAQGAVSEDSSAVALVDADELRILATDEPHRLIPGTLLEEWDDEYVVTSQSLPEYEGSNWNMLFATFIPQRSAQQITDRIVDFVRKQRVIAALAFVFVFTLLIYLISARLNRVLTRMTRFSQRALNIEQPNFKRGANQLLLLEDWMQHFTDLVLKAREEMSRRHEHALQETEALKAAVMEASLDAIVTLDRRGLIIDYNQMAVAMLGLDTEQAIQSDFARRFLEPAEHAAFVGMLAESGRWQFDDRRPHARGELRARRSDGSRLPVEISIVPIDIDAERVYTLYIHDITQRKAAEREIKSLARFASESPNPIMRVNGEGLIVYANAASLPLIKSWGSGPGRLLPATWISEVQSTLEARQDRELEDGQGEQIYSLLFVPIADMDYVNIYGRDITGVRRAEQESRQHQADLVHVSRLSTMGEMATGMAHELNQPLSAIVNYAKGASRRLQNGVNDPEPLVEAMRQVSSQAQRAGEIIRRLRALVGKQAPTRAVVDLNYLVREVCGFVEFETEKLELSIEQQLVDGEIPVNVDLVQIEQVLLNLVRNALDALEERPAEARSISIATFASDTQAVVRVADSGPGIPPERMEHLFDAFYTTKETGMGMGLAISQTIIEDHDGEIRAESQLDRGTVFEVRLPLVEREESAASATAAATEEPPLAAGM